MTKNETVVYLMLIGFVDCYLPNKGLQMPCISEYHSLRDYPVDFLQKFEQYRNEYQRSLHAAHELCQAKA